MGGRLQYVASSIGSNRQIHKLYKFTNYTAYGYISISMLSAAIIHLSCRRVSTQLPASSLLMLAYNLSYILLPTQVLTEPFYYKIVHTLCFNDLLDGVLLFIAQRCRLPSCQCQYSHDCLSDKEACIFNLLMSAKFMVSRLTCVPLNSFNP